MSPKRVIASMLSGAILVAPVLASDDPPIETDLVEDVEVGLILLDVVVLDWKDKPVAGLKAEDFAVEVDLRSVPIVSVDSTCESTSHNPNIVLAFDYQHLDPSERGRIIDWLKDSVARGATRSAEVMVVSLTGSLRVEQALDRDIDRLQATLARMQTDPALAGATFPHPNEDGFVQGLSSLYDVAGTFSGPTAVILYSSMFGEDLRLEQQYRDLAAQAAASRVSLYPMSVWGLTTDVSALRRLYVRPEWQNQVSNPMDRKNPGFGSAYMRVREARPTALSRLARETGGSTARGNNDAGLALVEVFERTDCSYTLAIRDYAPQDDRRRSIGVFPQRLGVRALHAASYGGGSDAARRQSALRAAHVAPRMFDTGSLHANLVPLRPMSAKNWRAQIAVTFPGQGGDLDVVLRRGPEVVHRTKRTIKVEDGANGVTFVQALEVDPGSYVLTSVLSDPATRLPRSVSVDVEIPEVPRDGVFLVGPVLGRRSGSNVVVRDAHSDEKNGRFEPLIGATLDEPTDLIAITQVCASGTADAVSPRVARELRSDSGENVGQFSPAVVTVEEGELGCASLVDVIPARGLKAGGAYEFTVLAKGGAARAVRFSVEP